MMAEEAAKKAILIAEVGALIQEHHRRQQEKLHPRPEGEVEWGIEWRNLATRGEGVAIRNECAYACMYLRNCKVMRAEMLRLLGCEPAQDIDTRGWEFLSGALGLQARELSQDFLLNLWVRGMVVASRRPVQNR